MCPFVHCVEDKNDPSFNSYTPTLALMYLLTIMHTLIMFYKQRFISNDFLTSLFLKKIKQRTSLFSKN